MHLSAKMAIALLLFGLGLTTPVSAGSSKPVQTSPQQTATTPDNPDASGKYHIGDGITAPHLIYSVDPEFTDNARKKKLGGTCIVSMIVDVSGTPQNVQVFKSIASTVDPKLRSAARGLDLNCVEAAKQYRFKPATYKGKPIPVEIKVEINYRIY